MYGWIVQGIEVGKRAPVWISSFYAHQASQDSLQAQRESAIAIRVQNDILGQHKGFPEKDLDRLSLTGNIVTGDINSHGVFAIHASRLFDSPKVIVWQQYGHSAFSAILETNENVGIAVWFLKVFANMSKAVCQVREGYIGKANIDKCPARIFALVDRLAPFGRMILHNQAALQAMLDDVVRSTASYAAPKV